MPFVTAKFNDDGPLIEVLIGVTAQRKLLLEKHGLPVPTRVSARALIDPGSSITLVDPSIPAQLGLHPSGTTSFLTASTGHQAHNCQAFDVSVTLVHVQRQIEQMLPFVEAAESVFFEVDKCGAIIGRDVLAHCLLFYDGPNATFSFAF